MSVATDLDTLARTIYGEARGEPFEGQLAVAWVILNRTARGGRFGTTVAEVCQRPKQFSCWNPDDPNYPMLLAANINQRPFLRAFGVACLALGHHPDLPDPTKGADHYVTLATPPDVSTWPPSWAAGMTKTIAIGGHQFFREAA